MNIVPHSQRQTNPNYKLNETKTATLCTSLDQFNSRLCLCGNWKVFLWEAHETT